MTTNHGTPARRHSLLLVLAATWLLVVSPASADDNIHWQFDSPDDLLSRHQIEPGLVTDGVMAGHTAWDPYVSLRVPRDAIDAARFTWLTLRLYSSQKADVLDIYYQSPDGRWCLGGKLPIVPGWAVYRLDLTKNAWRETTTGDDSRQWGGPTKRVSSLRIDPGNQADRWIALDYVTLEKPRPGLVEGVTPEPRGTARISIHAPASVRAGETLKISADLAVQTPRQLTTGTVLGQLRRGNSVLRLSHEKVRFSQNPLQLQMEFPISRWWYAGPATLELACYELDPAPGSPPARCQIEITSDREGRAQPPVVELKTLGGDAAIFVNGQPIPSDAYVSEGGLHPEYHRQIARAGIHLYCDWFGTSRASDLGHVAPDRYDYSDFDRYFAAILDIDPQAYFLPHVGITGPLWWQQMHPEELCQFENGGPGPTSFASELWKREMGEDLRRLIAYLRRSPYADRIIGYAFYNGYTAEWQMWGTWESSRDDYSQPALRAFRNYLTARYQTDSRLRQAWNDPQVTLTTAQMPRADRRRPGGPQVLRNPKTEHQAVDFYEFISNMDADAILHFAHIVRNATEGKALVGTYYAYLTAHGINQQDSGHLEAKRVFDSPDIDFLMSPPNYWYRKPGEAATFMSATDSFRLRGKLWLDESDHRTHLTDPGAGYGRAENLHETLGVYWRELAEVLTKRAAVSWFDMSGGWFSDPQILDAMRRGHEILRNSLAQRTPYARQVGVFVDPRSFYWMRPTDANTALDLYQVATMPQSGTPWDFLLLDDIAEPWMPDYRLYVFLNAFYVTPAQRDAIHQKLKRNHATALFVYAPGYLGPEGESLLAIEALTGIRIARLEGQGHPQVRLATGDPLAKGLQADRPIGVERLAVVPVFYADDPKARVVGRLVESDRPGLVVKQLDGWTSVYSAAIELPPALMRNLARMAGAHIWLESDDALYADAQVAAIHAATDGVKQLELPSQFRVRELISGKSLDIHGRTIRVPMKRSETVLLRLEPMAGL